MTIFQLLMLGASAFFAYKIYEHIQKLKDPQENNDLEQSSQDPQENNDLEQSSQDSQRTAEAFSTFDSSSLIDKADDELQNGNLDKALAIYSEANIKEPKNSETLFKMGYALGLQQRDEEALEYYKEALELDKNNPFTHLEMARIYKKDAEYASARTHLNAALEIDSEFTQAKDELEILNKEH